MKASGIGGMSVLSRWPMLWEEISDEDSDKLREVSCTTAVSFLHFA
jgi:hypothetical protein